MIRSRRRAWRASRLPSDFAIETLLRQPRLLDALLAGQPPPVRAAGARRRITEASGPRCCAAIVPPSPRAWSGATSLGLDDVDATLAGSTRWPSSACNSALAALEAEFAQRFGVRARSRWRGAAAGGVRPGQARRRRAQFLLRRRPRLCLRQRRRQSDGARSLAAEDYFARLGQQLAKLLDEVTADGFCHRVDLRLRPFGNAGRIALSFAAMEQYFQREGRDWERYAWQKARPVAGDIAAGERFLDVAASVRLPALPRLRRARWPARNEGGDRRRSRAQGTGRRHQARPGRHPRDRIPGAGAAADPRRPRTGLARASPAAGAARRWSRPAMSSRATGVALRDAYRFLRRLENRLQMLRDAQTHALPDERRGPRAHRRTDSVTTIGTRCAPRSTRIARAWPPSSTHCWRRADGTARASALAGYWRALPDAGDAAGAGRRRIRATPPALDASLRDLRARAGVARAVGRRARAPGPRAAGAARCAARVGATRCSAAPPAAPAAHVLRRASYLALLDEQPAALQRLVDVVSRAARCWPSAWRPIRCCSTNCSTCASPARCRTRSDIAGAPARRRCAIGRHRSRVAGAGRNTPGAEFPHRAGDAGCAPGRAGQRAPTGVAGRCGARRRAGAGAARGGSRARRDRRTRASRCWATAASAARNSASVRTWTSCSSTTRRPTRSPTAPARSMRRAGSRGWRRRSSRCSAR